MCLASAFDNERLDAVLVQVFHQLCDRSVMCQHDTLRIRAVSVTDRQLWMFTDVCGVSHEYRILFGSQLVREHLRLFVRYL